MYRGLIEFIFKRCAQAINQYSFGFVVLLKVRSKQIDIIGKDTLPPKGFYPTTSLIGLYFSKYILRISKQVVEK